MSSRHETALGHMRLRAAAAAGVTSLDFSQRNPHMLAVGMHDGTIALYDVRSRQATPVLASTAESGKHGDPVWKVRLRTLQAMLLLEFAIITKT